MLIEFTFLVDNEANEFKLLNTIRVVVQIVLFLSSWDTVTSDHG